MERGFLRYFWPFLLTAAALGLRLLLNPWLHDLIPFATFFIPITVSAMLGGIIPGLMAVLLSTLAAAYFFIPPLHSLLIAGIEHGVMLAADAGVSVVLVVLADLQRRTAAKATEGQRMLNAVMEYVPEGLSIVDAPDGKVRMISRQGAQWLGASPQTLVGRTIADYPRALYHLDGKTPVKTEELALVRALRGGEITGDLEFLRRADTGTMATLARAAPIRDRRGRIRGAIVVWRDITERKRLEQKLHERAKLESLGVLAGGIAHDFNNLLTSVLGHASLLMNEFPEGSAAWKSAQEISRAGEHAATLSRQMLDFSGHGRFLMQPVNLSEYVQRLTPTVESSISANVQLMFDLAKDLPAVQGDASQLQEVIWGVVSNAVEAIGTNPGRITIGTRQLLMDDLYVASSLLHDEIPPGTYVELKVSDSGPGMGRETVGRIFDPFFTTKFVGRGLGLAAVQGIVRGHGGRILVYTAPGQGTTICVLFPAAVQPAAAAESETEGLAWAPLGGGAVLVIDDEDAIRSTASNELRCLGYKVLTATDVGKGIEVFRASRDQIAVVLLDVLTAGEASEVGLRELKEIKPNVSVVLSSDFGEGEARRRFGGHRVAGFLEKPYSMRMLAERLHEAAAAVACRQP